MFIVYIYNQSNQVVAQLEDILDLDVQLKLNDISTASFAIYHTSEYCKRQFVKQYRRVKITVNEDGAEKTLFDGVIRGLEADLTKTSIKCESFEHLFDRRLLTTSYTLNNQTVDAILTTLLWAINSAYNTNITLDCGITTNTTKQYNKGETFLKCLKDLAGNGYEFVVRDMVLYFKPTIGIDRTTGPDFVEYRYDINEPEERSIDSIKMTNDGKDLANGVFGKVGNLDAYVTDTASITEFWLVQASFTTGGDQNATAQTFLNDHKDTLAEFEVDTSNKDFFEAGLGDIVSVYIYVGNDILFFDGSLKVIEKKYTAGQMPKIQFKLWVSTVKSKDLIEQIAEMQTRIKTLEMK